MMEADHPLSALLPCLLHRPKACELFFRSHMGRGFELDRELNHISPAWMSWLLAEAQTVGYEIRTQGLLFSPIPFLRFSFSFLNQSVLLSRSDSFSHSNCLTTPPFLPLPLSFETG